MWCARKLTIITERGREGRENEGVPRVAVQMRRGRQTCVINERLDEH